MWNHRRRSSRLNNRSLGFLNSYYRSFSKLCGKYVIYTDDTALLVRSKDYKTLDTITKRAEKEAEDGFKSKGLVTNRTKACVMILNMIITFWYEESISTKC